MEVVAGSETIRNVVELVLPVAQEFTDRALPDTTADHGTGNLANTQGLPPRRLPRHHPTRQHHRQGNQHPAADRPATHRPPAPIPTTHRGA